ncbi:MAG: hypothetical protein QM778_18885 [Myxococcales bacterium]
MSALPVARERPTDQAREAERKLEFELASSIPELTRVSFQRGREGLDNGARDLVTFALRPWSVIGKPLAHARYVYRGASFDAAILASGQVEYRQKDGVSLSVMQSVAAGGMPGSAVPALAFNKLMSRIEGDDPAVHERNKFLKATRALRDLLIERKRRADMEASDGRIEKLLRRALAEHSERERKHDAVYAVWAACADDEIGELGRANIEAFLREQCPLVSECGFRPADLARLNARGGASARFDPYREQAPLERVPDAGPQPMRAGGLSTEL